MTFDDSDHARGEPLDGAAEHRVRFGYIVPCPHGGADGDDCSIVHDGPSEHVIVYPSRADVPADARGPVQMIESHRRADGRWCSGYVVFSNAEGQEPGHHTLVGVDPLHVEPSLLCAACGSHGFIRDGRWHDA